MSPECNQTSQAEQQAVPLSFHTHDFIFSTLMITTLGMHIWSSSVGTQVSLTSFRLYLTWPEKY